jgi:hypothetical protein
VINVACMSMVLRVEFRKVKCFDQSDDPACLDEVAGFAQVAASQAQRVHVMIDIVVSFASSHTNTNFHLDLCH